MNFNEKLISLRKSKGLSQEELGAELTENVFNQLSIQTGLKFFYDQEIVNSVNFPTRLLIRKGLNLRLQSHRVNIL